MSNLASEINELLPPECGKLFEQLDEALAEDPNRPLKVVACGLYNAGKSSLLNCLTDSLKEEAFVTSAARETAENKTVEHQGILFTDTPGWDAKDEDNEKAWAEISKADVLLFLNAATGALDAKERDLLEKVAAELGGADGLAGHLVLVLSKLEKYGEDKDAIEKGITQQLREILGADPKMFWVANNRYKQGMNEEQGTPENRQVLVNESGIPQIRQYLTDNHASMYEKALSFRKHKISAYQSKILGAINAEIEMLKSEIKEVNRIYIEKETVFAADLDAAVRAIRKQWNSSYSANIIR